MTSCVQIHDCANVSPHRGHESRAFDAAARLATDGLVLRHDFDIEGRILSANSRFCDVTGFSQVEVTGQTHCILRPGIDRCWLALHHATRPGRVWTGEAMITAKDGRDLWLDSTIAAVLSVDSTVIGYSCVSVDVSAAVRVRDELRRHSKLMQLGQLTATVAHEIRNPLGAIRTASFVLERKLRGQIDGVGPQIDRINTGIQRCDKIISELLDVSRIRTVKLQQLPVDTWLQQTIGEDCSGLVGNPILEYRLGLAGREACFDPDQMRQVLINLLSNAAEAMADKSKTDSRYRPTISISTKLSGRCIEIAVADNGPGIAPNNLSRVREPLFTTKSFGVGLGMSAMERILENHGGYLQISSVFGDGATIVAAFDRGDPKERET